MQIAIRQDNFSMDCYELQIQDTVLEFIGKRNKFSLPYSEIKEFSITKDRRGKDYFTIIRPGIMTEGKILDAKEIDSFILALKEKMDGVINIEVRKN